MKIKKTITIVIGFIVAITFPFVAIADDTPHNPTNLMSCGNCHGETLLNSPFWGGTGTYDQICTSCHIGGGSYPTAPLVITHKDSGGNALAECRNCHNSHYQKQIVYKNTDSTNLYLAKGTIALPKPTYNIATNESTLNYSGTITYKTGWDAAKLKAKTGSGRGAILFPNLGKIGYNYPVVDIDETNKKIKVRGDAGPAYLYVSPPTSFAILYGQNIKNIIVVSATNKTVKFFDKLGTKSFADGDAIYDGVCEVCHTSTTYHRNNATGDHTHQVGPTTNCISCHPHTEGFKVAGGACNSCHGNPPIVDTATSPDGLVWSSPTGSATAGKHSSHSSAPLSYSCDACHYNNRTQALKHDTTPLKITMGFYLFGGVSGGGYEGGDYDGQNFDPVNYNYDATTTVPPTNVTETGTKKCSNIYCHSNVQGASGSWPPAYASPVWDGTVICGNCHKGNTAPLMDSGSHTKHVATPLSKACSTCHTGAGSGTTSHVNNNINISFASGYGGSYPSPNTPGNGYATCSNVYCHSTVQAGDGTSAPTYNNKQWGVAGPLTCTAAAGCHDKPPATPTASGAHATHTGAPYNYTCSACHKNAGDETAKHADRNIDMNLTNYGASAAYSQASNPPQNGYGYCQNTNCHGSGISTRGWGVDLTNDDNCTICHGNKTAGADKSATVYKRAPGADGTGVDTAGDTAATDLQVGAHQAHLTSVSNWSSDVACTECHLVPTDVTDTGHIDTALPAEIEFGTLAKTNSQIPAWNTGTRECSSTYCHGNGIKNNWAGGNNRTPTWHDIAYLTGAKSFDCAQCHGNPPGGAHPAGPANVCSGCHGNVNVAGDGFITASLHINGILEPTAGCTGCHGNPPTTATIGADTGLATPATGATSPLSPGAHEKHANTRGMGCNTCHTGNTMPAVSNTIQMGFVVNSTNYPAWAGTAATTGSFDGHTPLNPTYTFVSSSTGTTVTTSGSYANTCSSLYCHGGGTTGKAALTSGLNQSPSWVGGASQAACGTCHGGSAYDAASANPPTTGNHTKHASSAAGNLGLACSKCHKSTTAISHVNGDVAWSLDTVDPRIDTGAQYKSSASGTTGGLAPSATYGSCSNLYCHSKGTANASPYPAPNIAATWGGTLDATCTGCHNGNAGATNKMNTNAHSQHINNAGAVGKNIGCAECHKATASADRTISATANHVNKLLNVKFDNNINRNTDLPTYNAQATTVADGATKTPGAAGYNCSNVYCHSIGNLDASGNIVAAGGASFRIIAWNGAAIGCDGCHGNQAGKAHPVYTSGGVGSTTANSHGKHVESSLYSCDFCHNSTTINATIPPTTVINGGTHLNREETVSFKTNGGKTGTYNSVAKTCSTTYCHGTGPSVAWGGSTDCASCHGASNNGNLSVDLTKGHVIHYNTATLPTALTQADDFTASYAYGCKNCHPTNEHATGPKDAVGPVLQDATVNGTKVPLANYTQGGSSTTDAKGYNYTSGTCSTVCHTKDGVSAAPIVAAVWSGAKTSPNCGVCHNKVGDGSPAWSSPHTKHINTYIANTNLTCNACHSGTASDNSTINGASGRNQHPDTIKNVAMNTFAGGNWAGSQCSNTYCHSAGTSFASPTHLGISWAGSTACNSCHTGGTTTGPSYPSGPPKANSHSKHVTDHSIGCEKCHNDTTNTGNSITGVSFHVNKAYNMKAGGIYGGDPVSFTVTGAGTPYGCSSISCHNNGTATWGDDYSTNCAPCHSSLSSAHAKHTTITGASYGDLSVDTTGGVYKFGCGNCHPQASEKAAKHADGTIQLSLNKLHGGTLKSKDNVSDDIAGYSQTSGVNVTCTASYCHSKGNGTFTVTSPNWYGTYSGDKCGHCHGNQPDTNAHDTHVVGIHDYNIYTGTTGLATAGNTNTSSHGNAATSTTINCNMCHYSTVTVSYNDKNISCSTASCHDAAPRLKGDVTIAAASVTHLNGSPDVQFNAINVKSKAQIRNDITTVAELNDNWTRTVAYKTAGAVDTAKNALNTATMWTSGTKTCSNISCHNGNSVTWTSTTVTCNSCHKDLP